MVMDVYPGSATHEEPPATPRQKRRAMALLMGALGTLAFLWYQGWILWLLVLLPAGMMLYALYRLVLIGVQAWDERA